jgi:hypothetical protein
MFVNPAGEAQYRSAGGSGHPQNVALPLLVHGAGGDEQEVGQAVEIVERFGGQGESGRSGDGGALGAADDGAGEMERGGGGIARGQDEALQRIERVVEAVDRFLQPRDLGGRYAQRALDFGGRGEIGAEVEQIILDAGEHGVEIGVGERGAGDSDRRIGLIDFADGVDARVGLGYARAVDEAGAAVVPGAGVDLVELDQLSFPRRAAAAGR